ncbi:MAG: MFS transporter [Spirochaetes bacterium]|nr:MFS transporter [Spirochaetota bacterium]
MNAPSTLHPKRPLVPALAHRGFRSFWLGQCVSLVGTWMQNVGQTILVVNLTRSDAEPGGSPLLVGLVGAAQYIPMLLFSLTAGSIADRLPKRPILVITQSCMAALAIGLSLLDFAGMASYGVVLAFAFALGTVNALDVPTRQSFVVEMVGRNHLANAISLNSAAFNLARMVGPAVAGIMAAAIGTAPCFLLNGLSFLPVVFAIATIRLDDDAMAIRFSSRPRDPDDGIMAGLRYVARTPTVFFPLVLLAVESAVVMNYNVLIPVFNGSVLGGDGSSFGLLLGAMGAGSFLAAAFLSTRGDRSPDPRLMIAGAVGASISFAACSFARDFAIACILLALTGFFTILFTATTNALVQHSVEDAKRGRVMSIYALVFGGVIPFGNLYAGAVAATGGAPFAMALSGGIGTAAAFLVLGAVVSSRRRRERTAAE